MYTSAMTLGLTILKNSTEFNMKRMEDNVEIVSRLKFIGRIQQDEKINTKHVYTQSGLISRFSRTFVWHDSRCNTITFCQNIIEKSFLLIKSLERSGSEADKLMIVNIIHDLQQARKGLQNLKSTYKDDTKFCCDMDTLVESLNASLAEIEHTYIKNDGNSEETSLNTKVLRPHND